MLFEMLFLGCGLSKCRVRVVEILSKLLGSGVIVGNVTSMWYSVSRGGG